jgi:hypothetical protein
VIAGRSAMQVAGTAQVVRFNWPKYLSAAAIVASPVIASIAGAPGLVVDLLWAACAPGLAWTVTSLVATWWMYDDRRVYEQLTAGLAGSGNGRPSTPDSTAPRLPCAHRSAVLRPSWPRSRSRPAPPCGEPAG